MTILFGKKIFLGSCGIVLLITLMVLFNTQSILRDPQIFFYSLKSVGSPLLFKNESAPTTPAPECHLPPGWTSKNSSQPLKSLHLPENNTCLNILIRRHCYKDNLTIPNVVHYVIFGHKPMQLFTYLSLLGTWKHIKPCFIVIHGDVLSGKFYEKFLTYRPRMIYVKKTPKVYIFGTKISYIQHKADVARMEIILQYGGIYLDYDQIPLRSFDPLRNHSLCMGQETGGQLGNGVIVAQPSAKFVKIWMETYHTYNPNQWAYHSTIMPYKLSRLLGHLVFIVQTFFKPNYLQIDQLYSRNIDWSTFYAIHLYGKIQMKTETLESIRYKDSTFGSIARYIVYGKKDLQKKSKVKLNDTTTKKS